jgi:hypothetical protein
MPFDLMKYLNDHFPALNLDAGLFYRWPIGIRFDLSGQHDPSSQVPSEVLQRATALYEALFTSDDQCVVIGQEWSGNGIPPRYTDLFSTPETGLTDPEGGLSLVPEKDRKITHIRCDGAIGRPGISDTGPFSWALQTPISH